MIDNFHNWRSAISPMTVSFLVVAVGLYVAPRDVDASLEQRDIAVVDSSMTTDEEVTLGDPLRYDVAIEYPTGADLTLHSPGDDSRWSEVDRRIDTDSDGTTTTTEATLHYAIYRPGPTSGPPVGVRIELGDDVVNFELPSYDVDVKSVTDDGDALDGPGSPWPLVEDISTPVWLAIGGSTVAVVLVLLVAARRRDPYGDIEPPAPPHQRAHRALERLADSELLAEGRVKPYYIRLSGIIRGYLGDRFGFPGTELTTTEIATQLQRLDDRGPDVDTDSVIEWLQACDRVKFAGYTPTPDEAKQHLNEALDIVESTAPAPEPDDESTGEAESTSNDDEQPSKASDKHTESEPT